MDTVGQLELCPRFVRILGLPCQRPNNKNLLPIHALKNVYHRPVLVLVLVLINQYSDSDSYSCNNQVLVLVVTHIASTRTCTRTRKSGTRPSPDAHLDMPLPQIWLCSLVKINLHWLFSALSHHAEK